MLVVNIRMVQATELSLEAIGRFVTCSEEIRLRRGPSAALCLGGTVLVGQQYARLGSGARSGAALHREDDRLSRAQVTRLIAGYTASGASG